MTDQGKLFARGNHSNLGRDFERELVAVHDFYRLNGSADVIKNPNEWQFMSEKEYSQKLELIRFGKAAAGTIAACDNGRKIMRVHSDVDFSGGGRGFSICFDAKETSESNFPLSNIKAHQIQRLHKSSRCGTVAGVMIKFAKLDRVFFVPIAIVRAKEEILLRQMGRRAKPGTASLSIAELETDGIEIPRHKINSLWDWLPLLRPQEKS